MPYRRFTDAQGRTWEAWEVHPAAAERRTPGDRRLARRDAGDRRGSRELRQAIPRELRNGWLTLQAPSIKSRVAPIPEGWVHLSDDQLAELAMRAAEHGGRRSS
jgi:hypothetical protein